MPCAFKAGEANPIRAWSVQYCPTQYVIGRDGKISSRAVGATILEVRRMIENGLAENR